MLSCQEQPEFLQEGLFTQSENTSKNGPAKHAKKTRMCTVLVNEFIFFLTKVYLWNVRKKWSFSRPFA